MGQIMTDLNADSTRNIAVVVLNYCNYVDTVCCLDRIVKSEALNIVLVDNLSPDGSGERLRQEYAQFANVTYIQSGSNYGYAAGNNVGIKYAVEHLGAQYICVLNNDTLPTEDALLALVRHLEVRSCCGIVGPVILENSNDYIIQSAGANIDLKRGRTDPFHKGEIFSYGNYTEICPYVSGACMMFRASDLCRLGYLPECYFLFFEETEWCLRASRIGYTVECIWNSVIVHSGSASIGRERGLSGYLMTRNRAMFEKRNARWGEYVIFRTRFMIKILWYQYIRGRDLRWEIAAFRDGLFGRTASQFASIVPNAGDLQ